jgi:hypothetical protein
MNSEEVYSLIHERIEDVGYLGLVMLNINLQVPRNIMDEVDGLMSDFMPSINIQLKFFLREDVRGKMFKYCSYLSLVKQQNVVVHEIRKKSEICVLDKIDSDVINSVYPLFRDDVLSTDDVFLSVRKVLVNLN